jgi:hypothetical protein
MSGNKQQLIDAIEDAFGDVQLEDGISLREAIVLDNYGTDQERHRARSQDELGDWRKIPDETIARYSASLAFLDAKGMRFYLPAFMRFALRHYQKSDSASIPYTIYQLDCSAGSGAELVDLVSEKATEEQRLLLGGAFSNTELKAKFEGVQSYKAEKFTLLTEAQRDAVWGFLQFMAFSGHGDERVARRALERVWSKRPNCRQPSAPSNGGPATR